MRRLALLTFGVGLYACSGDDTGSDQPGPAGQAGSTGSAGAGGSAGASGNAGVAGSAGQAGQGAVPDTELTLSPGGILNASGSADFSFTCTGGDCSFECSWDGGAFETCESPVSRAGWSDGEHLFAVRAAVGDQQDPTPAQATFQVDAIAPTLSLAAAPTTLSNARESAFTLACSEDGCEFECSLDDGAYAPCGASPAFDGLIAGTHVLTVRGTDAAGNAATTSLTHEWQLSFGWRSLAVTDTTACAVSGDRQLYCWGSDSSGLLGDGGAEAEPSSAAARPTRVGTRADWDRVIAGPARLCAFDTARSAYCWGANHASQFGDDTLETVTHTEPVLVSALPSATAFGSEHSCAVDGAGALWCWGDGSYGTLGDGNADSHVVATPLAIGNSGWSAVATGAYHACALQDGGSLYCFGNNSSGECGQPWAQEVITTPTQVGAETTWTSVSAAGSTSCALTSSGDAYCWGSVGDESHEGPTRFGADAEWAALTAGDGGACGIQPDGTVHCWGRNDYGQLGSAFDGPASNEPIPVAMQETARAVVGTAALRCARTTTDQIWCWGDNSSSGLGRGIPGHEPDLVALDTGYTELSLSFAAYGTSMGGGCGIKNDGKLYCWGRGRYLGLGDRLEAVAPTALTDDTDWETVQLSSTFSVLGGGSPEEYGHGCAIRSGALYCWGQNGSGQLGLGDTDARSVPTQVTAIADPWSQVSVGPFMTCGIAGGALYCWGRNTSGELGLGDTASRLVPTAVGTEHDWAQITVNGARVLGRRQDGTLWVWGFGATSAPEPADGGNGLTASSDWITGKPGSNFWCGVKADGSLHCRILSGALEQVPGVEVVTLFDLDFQFCGKLVSGELFCFHSTGSAWALSEAPYVVLPAGTDWLSHEFAQGDFRCGLKTDGQRYCAGARQMGSFGDGFSERIPAPVVLPE